MVFRFPGAAFLSLEPADILSTTLSITFLRIRLVLVRVSGFLSIALSFLKTLPLLLFTVLTVPTFSSLSRVRLPVTATVGFFLPIWIAMREVLSELIRLPVLTVTCFLSLELAHVDFLLAKELRADFVVL